MNNRDGRLTALYLHALDCTHNGSIDNQLAERAIWVKVWFPHLFSLPMPSTLGTFNFGWLCLDAMLPPIRLTEAFDCARMVVMQQLRT